MKTSQEYRVPGAPYAPPSRQFLSEIGGFLNDPEDSGFPISRIFDLFPINATDEALKNELIGRGELKKAAGGLENVGETSIEVPFYDKTLGALAIIFPQRIFAEVKLESTGFELQFEKLTASECLTIVFADPPSELGIGSTQILRKVRFSFSEIRYELEEWSDVPAATTLIVDFALDFPESYKFGTEPSRSRRKRFEDPGGGDPGYDDEPPWWLLPCLCLFKDSEGSPKPPSQIDRCDSDLCFSADCMTHQEASDEPGLIVYTGWCERNIFTYHPDPASLVGRIARMYNIGSCRYEIKPAPGANDVYYLSPASTIYIIITTVYHGIGNLYNSYVSGTLISLKSVP